MANIKLYGNTWDSSNIYDEVEGKTQAEVNSGLKTAFTQSALSTKTYTWIRRYANIAGVEYGDSAALSGKITDIIRITVSSKAKAHILFYDSSDTYIGAVKNDYTVGNSGSFLDVVGDFNILPYMISANASKVAINIVPTDGTTISNNNIAQSFADANIVCYTGVNSALDDINELASQNYADLRKINNEYFISGASDTVVEFKRDSTSSGYVVDMRLVGNIIVCHLVNGNTYEENVFPSSDILTLFENAGFTVDTTTGWISGANSYSLLFDVDTKALSVVTTNRVNNRQVILFTHYYKSFDFGLLVDFVDFKIREQLASGIDANADSIQDVKNGLNYRGDVPTYYNTMLSERITSIKNNMYSADKSVNTFVFITDVHWERNQKHSPALINSILNNTTIQNVFCGGDMANGGEDDGVVADALIECGHKFIGVYQPFMSAYGNHDSNSEFETAQEIAQHKFSYDKLFSLMYKSAADKVTFITDNDYTFYFDENGTKTRYLFIDTGDRGRSVSTGGVYPDTQKAICELLTQTPEGYNVTIIMHFYGNASGKTQYAGTLDSVIDAYNARTSVTVQSVSYDYSNANGVIVCVMSGHTHVDLEFSTPNGVPVLVTDCDCNALTSNPDFPHVTGTVNEQAFDVVTADYDSNLITAIRVGRGRSRYFHSGAISVSSNYTLSTSLSGEITWATNDSSVATVSDGVVTAVASGTAIISAQNVSGKELWVVKV